MGSGNIGNALHLLSAGWVQSKESAFPWLVEPRGVVGVEARPLDLNTGIDATRPMPAALSPAGSRSSTANGLSSINKYCLALSAQMSGLTTLHAHTVAAFWSSRPPTITAPQLTGYRCCVKRPVASNTDRRRRVYVPGPRIQAGPKTRAYLPLSHTI